MLTVSVIGGTDHHDAAAQPEHVDLGPVEIGEALSGHDLVGGAHRPAAADQVEDAVHHRQDGVDLMGDEHHRGVRFAPSRINQGADRLLVLQVERQKRLVGEENPGIAEECLGDPQPLLLAAREQPNR